MDYTVEEIRLINNIENNFKLKVEKDYILKACNSYQVIVPLTNECIILSPNFNDNNIKTIIKTNLHYTMHYTLNKVKSHDIVYGIRFENYDINIRQAFTNIRLGNKDFELIASSSAYSSYFDNIIQKGNSLHGKIYIYGKTIKRVTFDSKHHNFMCRTYKISENLSITESRRIYSLLELEGELMNELSYFECLETNSIKSVLIDVYKKAMNKKISSLGKNYFKMVEKINSI